jgi:hypothetical protein
MVARKQVSRFNEAAAFVLSLISALHSSGLKASGRWEVRHDRHFGFGKAVTKATCSAVGVYRQCRVAGGGVTGLRRAEATGILVDSK